MTLYQWNWEDEYKNRPLWFDAAVLVNLGKGRSEFGLVDLHMGYDDPVNKRLRQDKIEYSRDMDTPYVRVAPHEMEPALYTWALRVKELRG